MLPLPSSVSESPAKPPDTTPPGGSRPSSTGAPEEPKRSLDYLLEDEPRHAHGRMYAALALLVVAGVLLGWHWHREGFPWEERPPAADGAASPAPAVSTSRALKPAPPPAARETQRAVPESAAVSNAAEPAKGEPQKTQAGPSDTQGAIPPPASGAAGSGSSEAAPPANLPQPPAQETGNVSSASTAEKQQADVATSPAAIVGKTPASPAKPSELEPPADSTTYADRLVTEGEKYLYGDGGPPNCDRAQKKLNAAAKRKSAKAQSLLGTMYATGHCVNRDLPTAYRWFAKALHQDPSNKRVQQDLEVLWRQMSADERQVALRTQ